MMVILVFMATLVLFALAATLPQMSQQLRRDREEEMIHRGVQYSRAIRRYFRKFGRYPNSIEELTESNHVRFLRRPYKDPITGEDFKLLHVGEVKMMFGQGIAGAKNPGDLNKPDQPAGVAGQNQNQGQDATGDAAANPADASSGSDASPSPTDPQNPGGGPTIGGGPVVGVASTSTKQSIREFNNKNHYNQWQFIYDPATDRGGLLNTPAQPPLQQVNGTQQQTNPQGVPTLGGPGAQQNPQMNPQQFPPDQ